MVMSVCAGGMGDAALRDRLPALWRRIEDAHYSYLETDDSPEKLQQKKKLEGYIMEYLSMVPHDCKFGVPETAKVFQRTINELPEFSAYRAGLGWAALGRYAANLLTQPWRKEYRVIRLYCGYYKHEVEANLVGAELLLHAMGYKPIGGGRLALDAPICPDMVAAISRDALIAQCECQIMANIWESAWSSGARVSWAEVAQARAGRGLTVPITAASIAYGDGSEIYSNVADTISPEVQPHTRMDGRYHNNIQPQCSRLCSDESHLEDPINHIHSPYIMPSNMLPPQLVYEVPPHMHSDVPMTISQCNPIHMIPSYGAVPYYYPVQTPYMIPTPVYAPIKHATTIPVNGYPPIPQYRYPSVPTGQLIELDSSVCENGKHERLRDDGTLRRCKHVENSRRNSTSKSGLSDISLPSIPRSDTQPVLSKAREDGMGTYESWDYVFRNLSSKDQDAERSRFSPSLDRDSRTLDRLNREERRTKYQPTTLDLEDGLQALNLDRSHDEDAYRTAKVNENLMRLKQEQELKRAKQLAKRQTDERKMRKPVDAVSNPNADGLMNHKVAPDKVRLLTKKDVKDRKDIIKQQNGAIHNSVEVKKVKKPLKSVAMELEKSCKSKPLENGIINTAYGSKSSTVAPNTTHANQEMNTHLIVTLDETDSIRRPTKVQQSDRERSASRTSHISERERHDAGEHTLKRDRWECITCTFLNRASLQACEMCGKSKKGPEIEPLTSGGRECPACTLVNKRDATSCDACGTSLEHCPTYI